MVSDLFFTSVYSASVLLSYFLTILIHQSEVLLIITVIEFLAVLYRHWCVIQNASLSKLITVQLEALSGHCLSYFTGRTILFSSVIL